MTTTIKSAVEKTFFPEQLTSEHEFNTRVKHEPSPSHWSFPFSAGGTRVAACNPELCCCGDYRLRGGLEKALISFLPNFVLICNQKGHVGFFVSVFSPLFGDFGDLRVHRVTAFCFLHLPPPLAWSVSQLLLKGGYLAWGLCSFNVSLGLSK